MPIMTELIVSVVGGVLTAALLALFSRPGRSQTAITQTAPAPDRPRRGRFFSDLFLVLIAVIGGIAIALVGGRILIQASILPAGLPTRLGLLVAGTALCWVVFSAGRR